ncbi:MAG: zinc ribbon domain-containing protein [Methanoregulaceae archaeon]|nr:MAG: zinc ribbon domain-containing protein [Methanoregulaceae archaeon]
MQCPDCGYEVDNAAVFCPQCRFQFQETDDVLFPDTTIPDTTVNDREMDESIFEERQTTFSDKELRMLEVQLMQPAVLVVLVISLVTYTLIGTIPFIPLTIAGLNFGITGILCLACGILAGIVFFFFSKRSLVKFRYR